jgi:hypothetical protein
LENWNTIVPVEYWNTWYGHLNIFRVIWGDRKTANFDEHMTGEIEIHQTI